MVKLSAGAMNLTCKNNKVLDGYRSKTVGGAVFGETEGNPYSGPQL
jgi:hypothetical protein